MTRLLRLAALALLGAVGPATSYAAPVVLNVTQVTQEHDQWCWAGTSRSALLYFGVDEPQCAIAEYARTHTTASDVNLGAVDCCADWQQGCNQWNYFWYYGGSIADILVHFGDLQNLTFDRPLSLDEVRAAIDAGRLALVRWVWTSGAGHFLLIHGYDGSLTYYMDPWPGEGLKMAEYAWMSSGGAHDWATSMTTGKPSATCSREGASCDDGDRCTLNDTCTAGLCKGSLAVCNASVCKKSTCEPDTGECGPATFLPEGTACDDGDTCTVNDGCQYGACEGEPRPCPATECLAEGACSPSSGKCVHKPVADGTPCPGGTCQAGECLPKSGGCSTAGGAPLAALAAVSLGLLAFRRRS